MKFSIAPECAGDIDVSGAPIAFAAWGPSRPTAIVLIHGSAAQMGWWDAVIARLAPRYRLIALDLSGNGDSGWRRAYTAELWASEVAAVAERIGGGRALVVGHSLGGRIAIMAAADHPQAVAGVVLVDAPVRPPGRPSPVPPRRLGPARTYPSLQDALQSFHLRPNEPVLDRDLLLRVAANSFKLVDGEWTLKSDPSIHGRTDDARLVAYLRELHTSITLIYGDRSVIVDDEIRSFMVGVHAGSMDLIPIAGGFHHLTFDQGREVADAVSVVYERLVDESTARDRDANASG